MMGVCMGKDPGIGDLESDGRFTSQFPHLSPSDGNGPIRIQDGESIPTSTLRFSEPRVPVIFVLGGPGSGKITHCDRAVQERHGLAHVNMTDLIQQHIVGNGLDDFNQMPANALVQVLMMEMKMAVNASGFLISGYPRSMRDVVEYTQKLRRVDRVILLNWHVKILEKQIEFGAQLGDTVLQLARMELKNYSKNVLAVADYFDQMKKLIVVDGERQPTEVYGDFFSWIERSLSGSKQESKVIQNGSIKQPKGGMDKNRLGVVGLVHDKSPLQGTLTQVKRKLVIWVIGGPGSNKSLLSSNPKPPWVHVSLGSELRRIGERKTSLTPDQLAEIRSSLRKGELVRVDVVMRVLSVALSSHSHLILDGFPRTLEQIQAFQQQWVGLSPPCILVDCSEVELGRSLGQRGLEREDNEGGAIKNRLTNYRLTTLPALKVLDDQKRLHIVDGDGEPSRVVAEFTQTISEVMIGLENGGMGSIIPRKPSTDTLRGMYQEVEEEANN